MLLPDLGIVGAIEVLACKAALGSSHVTADDEMSAACAAGGSKACTRQHDGLAIAQVPCAYHRTDGGTSWVCWTSLSVTELMEAPNEHVGPAVCHGTDGGT